MDALALSEASVPHGNNAASDNGAEDTPSTQGDNKFQRAIAAWRSMCCISSEVLGDTNRFRHRSLVVDATAGLYRLRNSVTAKRRFA